MSIITDNQITRGIKKTFQGVAWPFKNRGKLITLAFLTVVGTMAYDKMKPLDICDSATLNLKNAQRTSVETPAEIAYKNSTIEHAVSFIEADCPVAP